MATLTIFYDQINNELSNTESFLVDFDTTEKDLHGIYSSEDPLMPITVAYNKSIAESSMEHFVDSCSIEKMTEEKESTMINQWQNIHGTEWVGYPWDYHFNFANMYAKSKLSNHVSAGEPDFQTKDPVWFFSQDPTAWKDGGVNLHNKLKALYTIYSVSLSSGIKEHIVSSCIVSLKARQENN